MTTDEIKDNGANKQQQWVFSQTPPRQNKRTADKLCCFLSLMNLNRLPWPQLVSFGSSDRECGFFVLEIYSLRERFLWQKNRRDLEPQGIAYFDL